MEYALITGASSGIGLEISRQFAKDRINLILVSRNDKKLRSIAEDFEITHKIKALFFTEDLCNPNAAQKIFDQIQKHRLSVKYLVNNAGFYVKGKFTETSWEDAVNLIQIECINHTKLTKLLLPDMIHHGDGGIINVASTGSFVPGPFNAIYCAAKSFVLSFSEAIAEELKGTGVHVTTLCPGGTNTQFQDLSERRNSFFTPIMEPEEVAKIGYKAFKKKMNLIVPGILNKLQVFLIRFLPRRYVTKIAATMVT